MAARTTRIQRANALLKEARACTVCAPSLPHGTRPVLAFAPSSRVAVIGQAPGAVVHASGVPWDDKSGEKLREWMAIDAKTFYNPKKLAIIPMGFCFPGKGRSGDLPPRPECEPLWHPRILELLDIRLTLLIGQYAQARYLGGLRKKTLTETVRTWRDYDETILPLPHPSPRNRPWMAKNPWFEKEVVPVLRKRLQAAGVG